MRLPCVWRSWCTFSPLKHISDAVKFHTAVINYILLNSQDFRLGSLSFILFSLNPSCVLGESDAVLLSFPLSCVWSSNVRHHRWSIGHVSLPASLFKPGESLVNGKKKKSLYFQKSGLMCVIRVLSGDVVLGNDGLLICFGSLRFYLRAFILNSVNRCKVYFLPTFS